MDGGQRCSRLAKSSMQTNDSRCKLSLDQGHDHRTDTPNVRLLGIVFNDKDISNAYAKRIC